MNVFLQILGWILLMYGFFSLFQDIFAEISAKRLNHNMKIIIFAKKLEENLENFSIELKDIKRKNGYKNITLIDMEENDNLHKISDELEKNEVGMKILNKKDGEKYVKNFFIN